MKPIKLKIDYILSTIATHFASFLSITNSNNIYVAVTNIIVNVIITRCFLQDLIKKEKPLLLLLIFFL